MKLSFWPTLHGDHFQPTPQSFPAPSCSSQNPDHSEREQEGLPCKGAVSLTPDRSAFLSVMECPGVHSLFLQSQMLPLFPGFVTPGPLLESGCIQWYSVLLQNTNVHSKQNKSSLHCFSRINISSRCLEGLERGIYKSDLGDLGLPGKWKGL